MLSAGALDFSFGGTGFASSHPGVEAENVTAAVTSSGQIVQAGTAIDPVTGITDIAVVEYNADGTLNDGFGAGGIVFTQITGSGALPEAGQVLVDSQGRIVVVGGDGKNFEVLRYTAAGVLDSSFGTGGIVTTPIFGGNGFGAATRAAFDSAGDIIVGGTRFFGQTDTLAPIFRYQPNGTLDDSFGLDGMAFPSFPTVTVTVVDSLMVEQDGSIVIGGNDSGNSADMALLRFTQAGRPDPTFGTDGAVITSFGNSQESAFGLAQQPDGKILAVGAASSSTSGGFDLARYNPDGSLDTTFGSGGTLTTTFAGDTANALDVALDPDGKIVVGGSLSVTGQLGTYFGVARYLADGTLDPTFGTAGLATTAGAAQNDESAFEVSMALDPSSNIVLGSSDANFNLARLTGDPAVPSVPSLFSADESVEASTTSTVSLVFTVQLSGANTQRVLVSYSTEDSTALAGTDYAAASGQLTFAPGVTSQLITVAVRPNTSPERDKNFVLNLTSPSGTPLLNDQYSGVILTNRPVVPQNGSLDFTFGWAGFTQNPGGLYGNDTANDLAVQSDGKIVEIANVTDPASGKSAFGLLRYDVDGTLDPTFGAGVLVVTPISTGTRATANAVAIQPNGDIVVVGGDGTNTVVARYLPSGMLDTQFGTGGVATIAPPVGADSWVAKCVALDSQGNILIGVAAIDAGGASGVVMLNSDGTQNDGFGTNGLAAIGGSGLNEVGGIIVGPSGQITVQGLVVDTGGDTGYVGRLDSNGAIDTGFGTGGVVILPFAGGSPHSLAMQSDGSVLAVGSIYGLTEFITARLDASGLDTSFGGDGYVNTAFGNYSLVGAESIGVLPNGKIVVEGFVGTGGDGGTFSVALAQFDSNGTLDASFGSGGRLIAGVIGGASVLTPNGDIVAIVGTGIVPEGGAPYFDLARFNDGPEELVSLPTATLQAVAYTPTSMVFNVNLNAPSSTQVTVQFATADGTALAGTDYLATSGTLTFVPGSITAAITVAIMGNLYVEPSKAFSLNLSNPVGAAVGLGTDAAEIVNNNVTTWTNSVNPLDVNGDGDVTPADALAIINYLNSVGSGALGTAPTGVHNFLDTNGNQDCTPGDALLVINYLNNLPTLVTASIKASEVVGAAGNSSGGAQRLALTAITLSDLAFALVSGAGQSFAAPSAAFSSVTNSTLALLSTSTNGANSSSTGSAALAAAASFAPSLTQETDFNVKTDVEEVLDLLV